MQTYVWAMSYEYLHAQREFDNVFSYGSVDAVVDMEQICYNYMSFHMHEGLGALFVMDHFADDSKPMVGDCPHITSHSL